jgi:hypothetical protein
MSDMVGSRRAYFDSMAGRAGPRTWGSGASAFAPLPIDEGPPDLPPWKRRRRYDPLATWPRVGIRLGLDPAIAARARWVRDRSRGRATCEPPRLPRSLALVSTPRPVALHPRPSRFPSPRQAAILAVLAAADRPLTSWEIRDRLGDAPSGRGQVDSALRILRTRGVVVAARVAPAPGMQGVWTYSVRPDAPPLPVAPPRPSQATPVGPIAEQILDTIRDAGRPLSVAELVAHTGLTARAADAATRRLCRRGLLAAIPAAATGRRGAPCRVFALPDRIPEGLPAPVPPGRRGAPVEDRLFAALAARTGPVPSTELARDLGCSRRALNSAAARLVEKGRATVHRMRRPDRPGRLLNLYALAPRPGA